MFMICSKREKSSMTQALQSAQPLSTSIATPDELRELVGPPPVLGSEDDRAYDALMGRLTQSLAPRDFVEQLLIKEVVDCFWEVTRYTRQKMLSMERGFREYSKFPAHDDLDTYRVQQAGETVVDKHGQPVGPVKKPDARALEFDHARALARDIEVHERFNKLLIMTVGRRNEVLGTIERHRIGLGQWSRAAADANAVAAPDESAEERRQIAAVPLVPSDGPAQ
jgi:hypothetical protein